MARGVTGGRGQRQVARTGGVDDVHGGGGDVREASAAAFAVDGGALAAQRDDMGAGEVELPGALVDVLSSESLSRASVMTLQVPMSWLNWARATSMAWSLSKTCTAGRNVQRVLAVTVRSSEPFR